MFYFDSFADIGGDLHNASFPSYRVSLPPLALDPALVTAVLEALAEHATNLTGLLAFADSEPIALRWCAALACAKLGC